MHKLLVGIGLFSTLTVFGAPVLQSSLDILDDKSPEVTDCASLSPSATKIIEELRAGEQKSCAKFRFLIKSNPIKDSPFDTVYISQSDFSKKVIVKSKNDKKYLYINGKQVEPSRVLMNFYGCDGLGNYGPQEFSDRGQISCDGLSPIKNFKGKVEEELEILRDFNSPFFIKTISPCTEKLKDMVIPELENFVKSNKGKILEISKPNSYYRISKDGPHILDMSRSVRIQDAKGNESVLLLATFLNLNSEVKTLETTDAFGNYIPFLERPTKITLSTQPAKNSWTFTFPYKEVVKGNEVALYNSSTDVIVKKFDIASFKCSNQESFNIEETSKIAINDGNRGNLKSSPSEKKASGDLKQTNKQ